MATYLGQITRITRNDGYVPEMSEYKLNGKKQVEEWLNNVRKDLLNIDGYRVDTAGKYEQRNDIWERDGSYWSVWDYIPVNGFSWFEIIIVRAIKL